MGQLINSIKGTLRITEGTSLEPYIQTKGDFVVTLN